jgi:hypothetical protein
MVNSRWQSCGPQVSSVDCLGGSGPAATPPTLMSLRHHSGIRGPLSPPLALGYEPGAEVPRTGRLVTCT